MSFLIILIQDCVGDLNQCKKKKRITGRRRKSKTLIFAVNEKVGNLSIYNTTPRSGTSKIKGYIVKIYKSILLEIQLENEMKTILFTIA